LGSRNGFALKRRTQRGDGGGGGEKDGLERDSDDWEKSVRSCGEELRRKKFDLREVRGERGTCLPEEWAKMGGD